MRANDPSKPRRLRVAIVAPSLRILGGHAVQADCMLEGWSRDPDVDAWLVPINPLPPRPLQALLRVRFARTILTQLCYWPSLFRQVRRADVVHLFSASYTGFLLATMPAVCVAYALGKPIVLNYHSGEAPEHLAGSRLARLVLRHLATLVAVPSRFLHEVFATFGLKSTIVFNTIDVARYRFRVRTPLRPRLISTRNFEPLYNVACTLRAFGRVQQRHGDAALTVIGSGSEDRALRALAGELGLRNVLFLGRVAPADMARHYADADIYIQTPSIDNMPLSVLEAFASGLPVVSTGVGGVPAILTDHVHGLLARDNDDEAIAAAILELLDKPDLSRELVTAAYQSCRPYAWAAVRDTWLDLYRRALLSTADRRALPVEAA